MHVHAVAVCGGAHHQHLARVHELALGTQLAAARRRQLRAPQLAVPHHELLKRVGGHAGCAQVGGWGASGAGGRG